MYLVSNGLTLSADDFQTLYKKTVECGIIPQITQTERFFSKIAYKNRHNTVESFVCLVVGIYQIGETQVRT
jgi:hypothetical protein